ncbi:MAG TPA: hypothetical protein VGH93_07665 [Solirubrobacteraceae bacterium]
MLGDRRGHDRRLRRGRLDDRRVLGHPRVHRSHCDSRQRGGDAHHDHADDEHLNRLERQRVLGSDRFLGRVLGSDRFLGRVLGSDRLRGSVVWRRSRERWRLTRRGLLRLRQRWRRPQPGLLPAEPGRLLDAARPRYWTGLVPFG